MADRFESGRIEAFSDAVFSIAATLLVLEITIPESGFDDLWGGIADEWPSYLAYVTSFLTIGALWLAHHALFRRMLHADSIVVRINLLLLMVVAFLPFPTSLVAEAIDTTHAERAAVAFYGATLFVVSALFGLMARYVISSDNLLHEGAEDDVRRLVRRLTPSLGFYLVVLLLARVAPAAAAVGFLAVAINGVVRA
jgi:TMEM175 potassium channel family protein